MTTHEPPIRARFYGRSKGKTLRQGQAAALAEGLAERAIELPEGTLDLPSLYGFKAEAYRLEIGFGNGEHLLHRALEHPKVGFIGVEPFVNGMVKLLMEAYERDVANIRVYSNDATFLLRKMPEGSLSEVDLLYADPWPKRRQRKRRFVNGEALSLIARALKPGGMFRFASDIDDYVGWTLSRVLPMAEFHWVAKTSADWTTPYPTWPGTRYEAKALREGRTPSYLTFIRK